MECKGPHLSFIPIDEMLENVPVLQILACCIVGVLAASFHALRRPAFLVPMCLPGLVAAYRYALVGYLLSSGAVFVFCVLVEQASNSEAKVLRWRLCCLGILILAAAFFLGRWYELGARSVHVAGAELKLFSLEMWPALRLTTFLWEFGSGRVKVLNITRYVTWACLPFTLFGPVLRYSEFDSQFLKERPAVESGTKVTARKLLLGIVAAVAQIAASVALASVHGSLIPVGRPVPLWTNLVDAFVIGPWSFLLMWGGYFRLMECLALLWGLQIPPSFKWPFGRANISEFWATWNMTATSVFRDCLFYIRWGTRRPNLYLNTVIIFVLVGLWHGLNLYWFLFGLLHAIGFCCFIWYKKRPQLKRFEVSWIPNQVFGRAVTYVFVCSCWVLPSQILKFFGRL